MSRINLDPLMTFDDGTYLVVSTQRSKDGNFFCALYNAVVVKNDGAAFNVVSNHLQSPTCLGAQEQAYHHAMQLFQRLTGTMKRPPYLIWSGPPSSSVQ